MKNRILLACASILLANCSHPIEANIAADVQGPTGIPSNADSINQCWEAGANAVRYRSMKLRQGEFYACQMAKGIFGADTTESREKLAKTLDRIYTEMVGKKWDIRVYEHRKGDEELGAYVFRGKHTIHLNQTYSHTKDLTKMLIHEATHVAIQVGDIGYFSEWEISQEFRPHYITRRREKTTLTNQQAWENADSYAIFIRPKF